MEEYDQGDLEKISDRFRNFLKSEKIKQKELGKLLKMSQQTISGYSRTGKIPFHIMHAMRSIIELNVHWLLTGRGPARITDYPLSFPDWLRAVDFSDLTEAQEKDFRACVERVGLKQLPTQENP